MADTIEKTSAELAAEEEARKQKELTDPKPVETKPVEIKPAVQVIDNSKELAEVNKKLTESDQKNKELSDRLALMEKAKKETDIELRCKQLSEKGIVPAFIEKAKEYMLADNQAVTYSLSEKKADGTVAEKKMNLSEMIMVLAETIPVIKNGEKTYTEQLGNGDVAKTNSNEDVDKIKKYSEEHKVSFKEALRQLYQKNEIDRSKFKLSEG